MYYIINLSVDEYDYRNKGQYINIQSYHEVWGIEEYQVGRHSVPVLDTLLFRMSNNNFNVSVVVEHPCYVDNPAASWNEAFLKGKAAILKSLDLPKKLYFTED